MVIRRQPWVMVSHETVKGFTTYWRYLIDQKFKKRKKWFIYMHNHGDCAVCCCCVGNIRNLAMEKVATSVQFPCKYCSSGCQVTLPHTDKPDHEETCEYRSVVSLSFFAIHLTDVTSWKLISHFRYFRATSCKKSPSKILHKIYIDFNVNFMQDIWR